MSATSTTINSPTEVADRAGRWSSAPAETFAPECPYLDAVQRYAGRGPGRFHVPAHKGGAGGPAHLVEALGIGLELDVPSCIEGIDLGAGETPLERAQRLAAVTWGARRTWFLVNGGSEASHVLCLALGQAGGDVVVQRNVHSSTIHGLVLGGLRPVFAMPGVDESLGIAHCVGRRELTEALDRTPEAVAAFVVSPTYFGAAADVGGLADLCHERGVMLIADESWGAHFHFHDRLPQDALAAGADAVISGTHKLMGSLTQSSMLHLGALRRAQLDEADISRALGLVRTTSPSSLLLGSLDAARAQVDEHGSRLVASALAQMSVVKQDIRQVCGLEVLGDELIGRHGVAGFDPLRLAIDVSAAGINGHRMAAELLRTADINLELATDRVLIAHVGIGEPVLEGGMRLVEALRVVRTDARSVGAPGRSRAPAASFADPVMPPRDAYFAGQERVALCDAAGRVSADSIAVYPPGIANVLPGERFTTPLVAHLLEMRARGCALRGTWDERTGTVRVLRQADVSSKSEGHLITNAPSSESIFYEFPARSYLEKYYSAVGPENAAFVRSITDYLWARTAATDTVIEVAGGPCLYSLMSLMASRGRPFEHVTFTDIGWKNLREIDCWLRDHPSQFDYDPLLRWLTEEMGVDPGAVASSLRASTWELANFDWRKPVPRAWRRSYDVVSCHFFAESATADEDELVAFLRKLGDLGAPRATLLTSFICRSAGYTIGQRDFPAFAVDQNTIFGHFERAGLELEDVEAKWVPSEDLASNPGYEGLLFVAGALPA